MVIRRLGRDEVRAVWTIDRSEIHHHVYRLWDGDLVLTPAFRNLQGWPPDQVENDTPLLYACFDRGGAFLGMFHAGRLVGVAVIDSVPLGAGCDHLPLKYPYISRDHRGQGVGTRLFEEAQSVAREWGATFMYVSATPTENTVNFYRRRGCVVADTPDPELFALEPDDIHLVCAV